MAAPLAQAQDSPLSQLPLDLLTHARDYDVLVELKNGDTYNGKLKRSDNWMNMIITNVILTSKDGDRFWHMDECYIRGNTIKYLRIDPEAFDEAERIVSAQGENSTSNRGGNRRASRGRGGGVMGKRSWKDKWGGQPSAPA